MTVPGRGSPHCLLFRLNYQERMMRTFKNTPLASLRYRALKRTHIHFRPSFNRKVDAQRRIFRATVDLASRNAGHQLPYHNSISLADVSSVTGVELPRTLQGPCEPGAIDWEVLPHRFALKPVWGSGSVGVRVLKHQDDQLYDSLTGHTSVTEAIVCEHRRLAQNGYCSNLVTIEEKVGEGDSPPHDWKMFAFQGEVMLAMQIARVRRPVLYHFYDACWNSVRAPEIVHHSSKVLSPPRNPDKLTEAASLVSSAVDLPFARVDLYEDGDRVVLGEISPRPGDRMGRKWDRILGEAWERSEARMAAVG